ncbi:hypothetical protein StoSoilB19_38360 [Arthrobacter sp. StoSoilB19]|nr:hypothetical protein StoSoilB19_38360 [Arthrobacter sp. StoSoilB19]
MVTGNWVLLPVPPVPATEEAGPVLQADRVKAAAASTAAALPAEEKSVRRVERGPEKRGDVTGLLGSSCWKLK